MKVAYFTESLYPNVDGVSRTLARLFATLERKGVEFRVFAPFLPWPEVTWRDRVMKVPYVRFPLYPDYRMSLPLAGKAAADLRRDPPDLVHLVSPTPMAYRAQAVARRMGIPFVASFHTHFVSYFTHYGVGGLEPLGWRLLRAFYRDCARTYAPTRSIERELVAHGIDNVEIWSRGVDLERFSPVHRDPALRASVPGNPDDPILLLVSRLVKEKDLADLIAVDRVLRSRGLAYRFAVVGDGPMRAELESALPRTHFVGAKSGMELSAWYASADVFIFPSTTETLGNVVLEALASGVPAVVVDRGGPRDLIAHGSNGYVAKAKDPADIADRVAELLTDADLRRAMSIAARASATDRDWEVINERLLESYARVIDEHRAWSRGTA